MPRRLTKLVPFFATFALAALASPAAFAQGGGADGGGSHGLIALSAALAIGLAAFGGSLGQGRAAASALDGIARNPQASGKIFTPMIIGLALTESLVLLAFLIAYTLSGKIGG